MQHPYQEEPQENASETRRSNRQHRRARYGTDREAWSDLADNMVQFGTEIGAGVLGSIADALQSVGGSLRTGSAQAAEKTVSSQRFLLDRKLKDSWGGYLALAICGGIFGGCFAIAGLVMGILAAMNPYEATGVFRILTAVFALCTAGFGVMFGFGIGSTGYFGRLRKYLRVLRNWKTPVEEIARNAAVKRSVVQKDLKKATLDGHLPNTCLDPAEADFYLDDTLYHPEPAIRENEPQQEMTRKTVLTEEEQFRRDGADFLNYLNSCKGRLTPEADEELVHMRKICASIQGFVHNHPDQLPRLRRYKEYYLPTTRKLLDTALGLGDTDAGHAEEIRRDITGILHTLNLAFEKLYDSLLQEVSMDVSTEIDTLEAMLSQDGLTHDFASDFGGKHSL